MIEAIAAEPDADGPRLVYADSLMERRDPLGELIQVQCALARIERTDEGVQPLKKLQARERALLQAHRATWMAGLPGDENTTYEHRRGFIELISTNEPSLFREARTKAPLLRAMRTHGYRLTVETALEELILLSLPVESIPDVARLPSLRRLTVQGVWQNEGILAAALPQPLEELALDHDGVLGSGPDKIADALAESPERARLRRLRITELRYLGDVRVRFDAMPELEAVTLQNADLRPGWVLAMARALPRLTALDLSENHSAFKLAMLDTTALLEALPALRRLRLNKLGMTSKHAVGIATSPRAAGLTRLDLGRNQIGDKGARAIARSPHLRGLRRLNLNSNPISDGVKEELAAAFPDALIQLR